MKQKNSVLIVGILAIIAFGLFGMELVLDKRPGGMSRSLLFMAPIACAWFYTRKAGALVNLIVAALAFVALAGWWTYPERQFGDPAIQAAFLATFFLAAVTALDFWVILVDGLQKNRPNPFYR